MSKDSIEIIIQNDQVKRERMSYAWQLIGKALRDGPVLVTLGRPVKSRSQEAKYHCLISDIQKGAFQASNVESVKALMVAEFAKEMQILGTPLTHPGETVYSHKLSEWITVRPTTRKFRKSEAAAFIEYLYAEGSTLGVPWSANSVAIYDEYREAKK